jgi:vacuolar-type H+-ATPase subunit H
MTSEEIQGNISLVQSDREKWSDTLMKLNGDLVTAKGSSKRRISSAIKNAEQQIGDLDKRLKKLDQDLSSVSKTEARRESKNILAEKGIAPGAEIVKSIGSTVSSVANTLSQGGEVSMLQKKADASNDENKSFFEKYKMYILGAGALIILLIFMKRK